MPSAPRCYRRCMTRRDGSVDDEVEEIIVEQADERLAALQRDRVGEPGAAEAVVNDPIPIDPAESLLYEQNLRGERDAVEGLRDDRQRG